MIKLCLASQPIIMVLTRLNLSVMPNISPIFREFMLKRGSSKHRKLQVYAHRLSALVLGVLVTGRPLAKATVQTAPWQIYGMPKLKLSDPIWERAVSGKLEDGRGMESVYACHLGIPMFPLPDMYLIPTFYS